MSSFEPYWEAWRERLRREAAERTIRIARRRERAERLLPDIAGILAQKYGARRITLVGSLARGDFGERSDIDLVVEGLPADALFAAGAEVERLAGDIPVDIVPAEQATPRMRAAMERDGVVIHGSR